MSEPTEEQRKAFEEKLKNMSPEELKAFQKQQCVFCQIISGKIPAKKVYEDKQCLAFLDINPAAKGHLLLLPKEHYTIMPQITDKEIQHLFLVAKYLSQTLLKVLKVEGTNIFIANGLVAGQRAQHFMMHIIPRKKNDQILSLKEQLIDQELIQKIQSTVEKRLNELLGIKKVVEKQKTLEPENIKNSEKIEEIKEENKSKKSSNKEGIKAKNIKKKIIKQKTKTNQDINLDDIANLFK